MQPVAAHSLPHVIDAFCLIGLLTCRQLTAAAYMHVVDVQMREGRVVGSSTHAQGWQYTAQTATAQGLNLAYIHREHGVVVRRL